MGGDRSPEGCRGLERCRVLGVYNSLGASARSREGD